jgi:uncharacterized protein with HEPN domain
MTGEFRAPTKSVDHYVYQTFGERDWRTLHDLLVFADRAGRLVARGKQAYDADEMLRYAGQMICISIGEAATRLSDELLDAHPEIRFGLMRKQRNFAAHRYEVVDPEIIWETLATSFPDDKAKIAELLERRPPGA